MEDFVQPKWDIIRKDILNALDIMETATKYCVEKNDSDLYNLIILEIGHQLARICSATDMLKNMVKHLEDTDQTLTTISSDVVGAFAEFIEGTLDEQCEDDTIF